VKEETAKRKRDAGPDIIKPQIQALGAMDEPLDTDNTAKLSTKGQETWRFNLTTMYRQCSVCNKKKGNCHFPTQLHLNPACLECKHAWNPSGIKYNGTTLKIIHGKTPIRLLGIRYNMWLDSTTQRRYVMEGITELVCFLRKNRDLTIENSLRIVETPPGLLGTCDNLAGKRVRETNGSLCPLQQGGLSDVTKHVHSTFHLSERPRRPTD